MVTMLFAVAAAVTPEGSESEGWLLKVNSALPSSVGVYEIEPFLASFAMVILPYQPTVEPVPAVFTNEILIGMVNSLVASLASVTLISIVLPARTISVALSNVMALSVTVTVLSPPSVTPAMVVKSPKLNVWSPCVAGAVYSNSTSVVFAGKVTLLGVAVPAEGLMGTVISWLAAVASTSLTISLSVARKV